MSKVAGKVREMKDLASAQEISDSKLLLRGSNPSKLNTKIRKGKDRALNFVAFVFFDACICLFVNSSSLLLVSEAGHQKGRENKSGPARQGLSYITTPRCTLKLYFYSTSIETILQRARQGLSYITTLLLHSWR